MRLTPEFLAQLHTEERALERYGDIATEEDTADMALQVREGRGIFVRRKTRAVSVWVVWWPSAKRVVPVLYSRKRGVILTMLPLDALPVPADEPQVP